MKILTLILSLLFLTTYSTSGFAHKLKTAFTIALYNENSGNLEFSHRFYLHDAEEAVWELIDKTADIIGSETTQEQFSDYIQRKFVVTTLEGQTVSLTTLGYEADGAYFWLYQEVPITTEIKKGLKIRNDSLRDIWFDQVNVVNIELKDETRTLSFSEHDSWLTVDLTSRP